MVDEKGLVKNYVARRIAALMNSRNDSAVRAKLANLRRGIGKPPGAMPELWDMTLEDMPAELYSNNGVPTYAERAVYSALTLFALHQQGSDVKKKPMSVEGSFLGEAVRRLVRPDEDETRIKRRFNSAVTADGIDELTYYLRGLIQLLKNGGIPLDYPALAAELYLFQFEDARNSVRLRWGQDFYRRNKNTQEK